MVTGSQLVETEKEILQAVDSQTLASDGGIVGCGNPEWYMQGLGRAEEMGSSFLRLPEQRISAGQAPNSMLTSSRWTLCRHSWMVPPCWCVLGMRPSDIWRWKMMEGTGPEPYLV